MPCPPPGDLSDPGIEPTFLMSPALAGRFYTTSATIQAIKAQKKQKEKPRSGRDPKENLFTLLPLIYPTYTENIRLKDNLIV